MKKEEYQFCCRRKIDEVTFFSDGDTSNLVLESLDLLLKVLSLRVVDVHLQTEEERKSSMSQIRAIH